MISNMFAPSKNWIARLPSKATSFAILALIAVGQLEAQVPRRTISDGPPTIPEPVDGKVHGDLPPGRGVCDFIPYLQAIKELNFDGTISIELEYSPEPDKIVEWVEEAYRETDALMQRVGLRS